jgi:putative DNA primase/helicase
MMADKISRLEERTGRKAPEIRDLQPIELAKFLDLQIPVKPMLLAPWLRAGSLTMVYAQAGRCKTFWLSALAISLRHGVPFLGWKPTRPTAGLYIDGEMVAEELQSRFHRLLDGIDDAIGQLPLDQLAAELQIVTPDLHPAGIPKIDSFEGQEAILRILDGNSAIAYVILDNLSCLSDPEDSNSADSWGPVQSLLLELRRRGIAVLFAHHANKTGGQRGTNRKVDVLDNVIRLEMDDAEAATGRTRVTLDFNEKARFLTAGEKGPYSCLLEESPNCGLVWNFEQKVQEIPKSERITEMLRLGMSPGDIANETGDNRSYVYRIKQKLEQEEGKETRKRKWNSKT